MMQANSLPMYRRHDHQVLGLAGQPKHIVGANGVLNAGNVGQLGLTRWRSKFCPPSPCCRRGQGVLIDEVGVVAKERDPALSRLSW
jgi:hypothetical protein